MGATLIRFWRRLRFRLRRDQLARELAEELDFHQQSLAEKVGSNSLSRREMGNVTIAQEECRDVWGFMRLERFLQDVRHAFRMYLRTPLFTAICVVSIAVGIGGNAAMLTLVNTLLLRPLPFQQPDRLVRITGIYPRSAVPFFQARSRAMEVASISFGSEMNLVGQGAAIRVFGSSATPNAFSVLGTSPAIGRTFRAEEDSPGRDRVVILSHSMWRDQFASDPAAVGRIVKLEGIEREIVGVMPASFSYPSDKVMLWFPMRLDPSNFLEYWGTEFMPLLARLRPAASLAEARGEVRELTNQFRGTFPYPMARDFNASSTAIPLHRDMVGDVRERLLILLVSVAGVLLIACANVASMLLARTSTRRKELALRAALGAGRLRIIRQLLTESLGLAIIGAGLGIVLGNSVLSIFKAVLPASLPGVAQATIDWQVLGAVAVLALTFGLASGLAPALSASQTEITETIKTGGQRSLSPFWASMRSGIISAEVALTLVLLISAGLLLKSVYMLSVLNPGFDADGVVTIRISPNQSTCAKREACVALYDRLINRAESISGVSDAAISNSVPLDGNMPTIPVDVEGHPNTAEHPAPMLWFSAISPGYLRMLHVPLLAGRYFTRADGTGTEAVLVVGASTAKHFWPGESAIGKHIRPPGSRKWRTIVGVVGDVQHFKLSQGLPSWIPGDVYMPYSQAESTDGQIPAAMTLLAKTGSNGSRTAQEIETLAKDLDPAVPVGRVEALKDIVAASTADIHSTMTLFVSFACAAILLAAVGIYGLMSYWVSQRTYEIGLRMAIGCPRNAILSMILGQSLTLTLYGVMGGLLGSLMLTRFLSSQLYGVDTTDVLTFAAVTALVFMVALMATAVPAWRATRIDPLIALRAD